eukprot:TRINITY_DN1335_c0_g1_i2.p1 TRINITY_DN1335_c0_g1~~TRINITY_DN1335_c0_g1_i2.p1  ORF type:complete len:326 (-),score=140.03 TRINITY_DN1335_c0_g1_i2:96-1016(-)
MTTFKRKLNDDEKSEEISISIPSHLNSLLDEEKLFAFNPFKDWFQSIGKSMKKHDHYHIKSIEIQSVDLFGKAPKQKIGFVKFTASVTDKESNEHVPGIVFMRGGAVGMLVVLEPQDDEKDSKEGRKGDDRCVILTVQPRIPMGTFRMIEIPAGMVDEEGKFAGQAAKELEEECGLKIKEDQLIDLTELAYQHARKSLPQNEKGEGDDEDDNGKIGIYTSPGGSDEYLRLFLYKHSLPRSQIKEWEGKMTGNLDEGEKISLRVVPLKDLWKITKDAKALSALALWEGLKREGILDENDNSPPAKKE